MTEPNSNVPDYHDPQGEVGTFDNVAGPNDFYNVSVDDYGLPGDENMMFNVEGNNDLPSGWESQNTQFVYDPSQADPSGVQDQSGGQNAGYFDPENYVDPSGVQDQSGGQNVGYFDPENYVDPSGVQDQSGGQNAGHFDPENYVDPSGVQDQSGGQIAGHFDHENYVTENSTQLLERPVPSLPYDCSFCHVLREIIHKKGEEESTKLQIHGRFGMICHGILEVSSGDTSAPSKEYQTFDFCNKSIPDVKKFLLKYFEDRIHAYYTMVDDPLLTFYDALCVQSDWDIVFGDNLPGSQGNTDTNQPEAQSNRPRKRTFKEQKEYAQSVTIKDMAKFFHLTEDDAAKRLEISTSKIKKEVHKAGLERWPYRKIEAIENRTKELLSSMDPTDPTKNAEAEAELQRLQRRKAEFYAPFQ